MNRLPTDLTRHGLTLRGGAAWPDIPGCSPRPATMPTLLIGPTTEQQLLIEQTSADEARFWDEPDEVKQHMQDILRANFGDEDLNARALNSRLESLYPGSDFSSEPPPYVEGMDLALDEIVKEECAEVIQEVCKVNRFGMVNHVTGVNNKLKLETEIGQLLASIERLAESWNLDNNVIRKAAAEKFNAIEKWAPYYERNKQG
jgi:NTP pyrophosphatase (non-canonical NTP hydrolase)